MKRSFLIPTIIGLVAVMAVGYWGYREQQMRQSLETYVNNNYQRAFYNMTDHVQNLEVLLGKSLLVSEKKFDGKIYNDIWQHANAAQENLTQLPIQQAVVGRTAKFLSQVGDYSHVLAAQAGAETEISGEKWETLNKLYQQAQGLNKDLQDAQSKIVDGTVTIKELTGETKQELKGEAKKLADGNFQKINEQMQEYPTLIYDGPFSDHLERSAPKGISGKDINSTEARNKALSFIDGRPGDNRVARVTETVKGKIPSYRVEINSQKNKQDKTTIDVSRKGGYPIWLINTRPLDEPSISINEAKTKAKQFLTKLGYKNMKDTYHIREDGAVTFNFAYMDKNVIVYPDLIKVSVALDRGDVIAMDALSYLMSHHDRKMDEPKVTLAEAKEAVNKHVDIKGNRMAVIPLDSGGEKLTYEFDGVLNNEKYFVYIDTRTGKQAKILRVIEQPEGTLTM